MHLLIGSIHMYYAWKNQHKLFTTNTRLTVIFTPKKHEKSYSCPNRFKTNKLQEYYFLEYLCLLCIKAVEQKCRRGNLSVIWTLSKALLPNHRLGEEPSCMACRSLTFCPKSRRMAVSNYTWILEAGGGCHGMLCYSERRCGRCCQATKAHSDHRWSWL